MFKRLPIPQIVSLGVFPSTVTMMLGLLVGHSQTAQAALIAYQFQGTTDQTPGPLPNEFYLGSFSFDNSVLTSNFSGDIAITNLEMTFLGTTITDQDSPGTAPPTVSFFEGNFLGLNFSVINFSVNAGSLTFSFVPGTVNTTDSYFSYEFNGAPGAGDVNYTLIPTQNVPEPSSILGLVTLGLFARVLRKEKGQ